MDVVLVCNFWHFEFEKESSRYRSLAEVISKNDKYNLEVVTSSFRHQTKKQRNSDEINKMDWNILVSRDPYDLQYSYRNKWNMLIPKGDYSMVVNQTGI